MKVTDDLRVLHMARMIRNRARANGIAELAVLDLETIAKSLDEVLQKHGFRRKPLGKSQNSD